MTRGSNVLPVKNVPLTLNYFILNDFSCFEIGAAVVSGELAIVTNLK